MCAIEIAPAIRTERLALRSPRHTDAPRIAELANDFGVAGRLSHMPHPYGRDDAEQFLARTADLDPRRGARFAIDHPRDGLIGMMGFDPASELGPELGYWLGRPYWGRGYATEAARAALGWAGSSWGKKLVVAGHHAENDASGEVLVKAGFLYTGEVKARPAAARGGEPVPTRMMIWLA